MEQTRQKSLQQEESVQELLSILIQCNEKGLFDSLIETVNHVQDMEQTVSKMEQKIEGLNHELSEVKKQNDHLVQKAEQTVMDRLSERVSQAAEKVAEIREKLNGFRQQIRSKCRQIAENVKAQGKKALNGIVGILHIREGVKRLKGVTERMEGRLDALSESVEQAKEFSVDRTEKQEIAQPQRTYQNEIQNFVGQAVAENRSYGSGADAFDAFMAYRDEKGTKDGIGAAERAVSQPLVPITGSAR